MNKRKQNIKLSLYLISQALIKIDKYQLSNLTVKTMTSIAQREIKRIRRALDRKD